MQKHGTDLKNFARGGLKYHDHRLDLIRLVLEADDGVANLSPFLRDRLFKLNADSWRLFDLHAKDWEICDRLLGDRTVGTESRMMSLVLLYVGANAESVRRLYAFSKRVSDRLVAQAEVPVPKGDVLSGIDGASLFGIRIDCASLQASTDEIHGSLRKTLTTRWARTRLTYPMMYYFAHKPPAAVLDTFLSYIITGNERDAEKLALKLLLSDEAARETSLAFRAYIGMAGHPFDALEMVLDHLEFVLASAADLLPTHREFLERTADLLPGTRAEALRRVANGDVGFVLDGSTDDLRRTFNLPDADAQGYAEIWRLAAMPANTIVENAVRPYDIVRNMRAKPYPLAIEFQRIVSERVIWFFVDAGRLIGALLRSMYMVERTDEDLEARDVLRMIVFLGHSNGYIAAMPGGMPTLTSMRQKGMLAAPIAEVSDTTGEAVENGAPFPDRLWIIELQWRLRNLQEQGRITEWLAHVRAETKLRPSYLTGINWHWVEDVIRLRRLKPFQSFDGAYLFVHMELEAESDPLRLRLTLEPLIRTLDFEDAVRLLIEEFGIAAAAIVRRYLTPQNLLASGLAPNYIAALYRRVDALEACIKAFDFNPLLTEGVYRGEVKALTAEAHLSTVNAGKFEVPWETFRKDALDSQENLFMAVESLRLRSDDEPQLTSYAEVPTSFPNGRTQTYRVRRREGPLFAVVAAVIQGYMHHPAFGLEVILSGRFRHNNLLQEIWSAISDTTSSRLPSVLAGVQRDLTDGYLDATEAFVDNWCAAFMQTRRAERPRGLFDLVPEQKDVDDLLARTDSAADRGEATDVIILWIKNRLRQQVAAARDFFQADFREGLATALAGVRDHQLASVGEHHRTTDAEQVHGAVTAAVQRRIDILASWFDGVDAVATGRISLADLNLAAEALFDNVFPEKSLRVDIDASASEVGFEPEEVKIAFDLLRETYYNALKKGRGPEVRLEVRRVTGQTAVVYSFANERDDTSDPPARWEVEGSKYNGLIEALTREGNSGLAKIAASSATLLQADTTVMCHRGERDFELVVGLREEQPL